jgi:transposase
MPSCVWPLLLMRVGQLLGKYTIPTTTAGYAELVRWQYGELARVGMEGTGSYGAGLARWLLAHNVPVLEVDRPDRTHASAAWQVRQGYGNDSYISDPFRDTR